MANKEFILGDGENGVVKKTINFPADNSLSIADIVSKLKKITEEEKMSFRFNISVGFIMQNIETGTIVVLYLIEMKHSSRNPY